jgi:outer membrane protein TolC
MKPIAAALIVVLTLCACSSARAQGPGAAPQDQRIVVAGMAAGSAQNPLSGGIPAGAATPNILPLSLKEAVDRGLRYNLGIALGQQNIRAAESSRLRALSKLLPHVTMETSESVAQTNLASFGFPGLPGINPVVGPFAVFDVRALVSQTLFNLSKLDEFRAGAENLKAAEQSYKKTRDLVVLACIQLYMQAVNGSSRIEAAKAQLKTAQALYDLAVSRRNAGFVPGIEVLRAQVQMQTQQQRLLVAQNEFAKQKLNLAQAVGLPLGQEFDLTDPIPYSPLADVTLDSSVQDAYRCRGDFQGALAKVQAAEISRRAAVRQKMPSLDFNAHYGDTGQRPTMSHGTFAVVFSLRLPIFQGRETEAKILESDSQLQQQKADLESLRARIYYEIRTAFLDLKSSEERVSVAKSNLDLVTEQVNQAQDRFAAGVASNIEVVQAQDALAMATEDHITSLYAHNLAKIALAEAMGMAESGYERFLQGK